MAAFGGRRDIMAHLAPLGPVYQAGTLSGNPIAVAAGLATLKKIQAPGFYDRLHAQTRKLVDGIILHARTAGVACCADHVGGMFGIYFSKTIPQAYAGVCESDIDMFKRFFHAMLSAGVYLAPSAFEAGFVSIQHDDQVIEETLLAVEQSFASMQVV